MTIRKGEEWGVAASPPLPLTVAAGDAELAALVALDAGGCYGLSGGDLHRSVGSPPPRADTQRLPIDALMVTIDDRQLLAVAHVIALRHWWTGPLLAVMNCDHLGRWNVAPRAHPNDGRFDVVEVSPAMSLRHRLQARRRLMAGTHVPHPDITVRVTHRAAWTFESPTPVRVDGIDRGRCTRLAVAISPDHFAIYV